MTGMREDAYILALAGLLHDIGKFAQGAGACSGAASLFVADPWTTEIDRLTGLYDEQPHDHRRNILELAGYLATGERSTAIATAPEQLLSIFCRVSADSVRAPEERYWPLRSLALERDVLFAGPEWPAVEATEGYERLWTGFEQDLKILNKTQTEEQDLATYLESLQLLMQRYTWCVPSAHCGPASDISLYDHSRMRAALAVCLLDTPGDCVQALLSGFSQWSGGDPDGRLPEIFESTDAALLVGGDISGVQDFIYTVTARGATSALRGRSFYLQLLTECIARRVLQALGLPMTNLIYQGGGNFYLLVPPDATGLLCEVQREISEVMLKHHKGELYLALAWEPLKAADFYGGRIAGKWDSLAHLQQRIKQRRFAELGGGISRIFDPEGHGGEESDGLCLACGREHPDTVVVDDVRKCRPCQDFEELGRDLRNAGYWTLSAVGGTGRDRVVGTWGAVLADLGLRAAISDKPPGRAAEQRVVLALSDEALRAIAPSTHTAVGRRFLVNVTPTITPEEIVNLAGKVADLPTAWSVKPFSAMAEQSQGIKRLGVLRMDVDNLGALFAEGLGDRASLARVAGLSFAVSLFFEGWVASIANEISREAATNRRGDTLYSIYSGGDDLFFVGAWDAVVPLAQRIRADLTRYACDHPGIHASAGIVLIGRKYPLYQAAADAGEAESEAKALRWRDMTGGEHAKDAIAFLDTVLPWEQFGYGEQPGDDTVAALTDLLTQEREKEVTHGVIRALLRIYVAHREAAEKRAERGEDVNLSGEKQVLWGPWIWRGYYRLRRAGELGRDLAERFHGHGRRFGDITWVGVAARWAELLTR